MGNSIQGGRAHLTGFSRRNIRAVVTHIRRLTLASFSFKSGETGHAC